MSIEDVRTAARTALHARMSRPGTLYLQAGAEGYACTFRYHMKPGMVGDLPGTNLNYSEMHDQRERVILWCAEVDAAAAAGAITLAKPGIPSRGAVVVESESLAYLIDNAEPRDGLTVRCEVTKVEDAGEIASLISP